MILPIVQNDSNTSRRKNIKGFASPGRKKILCTGEMERVANPPLIRMKTIYIIFFVTVLPSHICSRESNSIVFIVFYDAYCLKMLYETLYLN